MTKDEFNSKLNELIGEAMRGESTIEDQTTYLGLAEYALFAWKQALSRTIAIHRMAMTEETKPEKKKRTR